MLQPALGDHVVQGHEAALESRRIGHRQPHALAFRQPDIFARLFKGSPERRDLQDMELLLERRLQLLVTGMRLGRHQQTIELILHDEPAIVAIGFAVVFRRGSLGFLRVLIGHGLDLQAAGRGRRFEQTLAAVVQSQNGRR